MQEKELTLNQVLTLATGKMFLVKGMLELLELGNFMVGKDIPFGLFPAVGELSKNWVLEQYPKFKEIKLDYLPGEHMEWIEKMKLLHGEEILVKSLPDEYLKQLDDLQTAYLSQNGERT